jgi:hypothetical protein
LLPLLVFYVITNIIYLSISRATGSNFVDGNLSKTFEDFADDHICNKFCKFFNLLKPIPLDNSVAPPQEEVVSSKGKGRERLFIASTSHQPSYVDEHGSVAMEMSPPSHKNSYIR